MSWIKLDDQWMDHPKIVKAGRDARDMWLASITWCAKHLTDGFFPKELLPSLAVSAGIDVANCQSFATTLVGLCLWDVTDFGYCVHDYLDYNPSKEQAEATKVARSQAGRAGGIAKASKNLANNVAKSQQNPSKSLPRPRPPTPVKSPRAKNARGERDPNLDNPAVVAYREVAKTTPDEIQRTEIIARVKDTDEWREDVTHWIGHGWNKRNVTSILAFHEKGGRTNCSMCNKPNNNGNGGKKMRQLWNADHTSYIEMPE